MVPVSWGELIDKITILEIKVDRLRSAVARDNASRELILLRTEAACVHPLVIGLAEELKMINERLWDAEEKIRRHEAQGDFGEEFIRIARIVYKENDDRYSIKRKINVILESELVEEKSYSRYE